MKRTVSQPILVLTNEHLSLNHQISVVTGQPSLDDRHDSHLTRVAVRKSRRFLLWLLQRANHPLDQGQTYVVFDPNVSLRAGELERRVHTAVNPKSKLKKAEIDKSNVCCRPLHSFYWR